MKKLTWRPLGDFKVATFKKSRSLLFGRRFLVAIKLARATLTIRLFWHSDALHFGECKLMSVTFKGAWFGWAQGSEQLTPIANVSISKKVIHEGSFPFPDKAVTFEAYEHKVTSMTLVTEFFKIEANNRKHTFRMIFANLTMQ